MSYERSKNIKGQKFNRLTAIETTKKTSSGSFYWKCLCDCGKYTEVPVSYIIKGTVKSCGCLQREFIKTQGGKNRKPIGEADRNSLFRKYKQKSKTRNLPFFLTLQEFTNITSSNCHYCGIVPLQISKRSKAIYFGDYKHNGIDRIDNNIGYVYNNCVPCCKSCNFAKGSLTVEEFESWIVRLVEFRLSIPVK